MSKDIIEKTKLFVQETLKNAEGGHDWQHTLRVFTNAKKIAKSEAVNEQVVLLAALLHDIADSKFHDGDEKIGPKKARLFLEENAVDESIIGHVVSIIANVSFSKSLDEKTQFSSLELKVVQDADRLDAIGAIGIARVFNYGGFKNRKIYDPEVKPQLNMTKAEYKKSTAPTINHFYEKLLLLKNRMNTKTGKRIASNRHKYMVGFLKQFYAELEGEK